MVLYLFMVFFGSVLAQQTICAASTEQPGKLIEDFSDRDMKILVLIIASDNLPVYVEEQKIWRAYMHLNPKHVEAYFIKADPTLSTPFAIKEDIIWARGAENVRPGVLNKTLLAFEALLPRLHEFDYVIRTNLSSFYVFPRLFTFLETLPKEQLL